MCFMTCLHYMCMQNKPSRFHLQLVISYILIRVHVPTCCFTALRTVDFLKKKDQDPNNRGLCAC